MRVGIATDHGGFGLKEELLRKLRKAGHKVVDFGAYAMDPADDYPDFVVPLAQAVVAGKIERGVAICGDGGLMEGVASEFYEYFHGDNGAGLGASHQTGWTGLVAPLLDIFGRVDAKTMLETEGGRVMARVVREQVGGEPTGGN